MVEEWRTCVYNGEVFEDYEVSSYGNVRNAKTGKALKLTINNATGYLQIGLRKDGKRTMCKVHRLVAFTFIKNDDIENKTEVNHISEVKTDNHVENLEWCTSQYNYNYGTRTKRAGKTKSKKVIGKSLTENKVIILNRVSQANDFGFDASTICKCCKGKYNQHKGYTWHYID